MHDYSTAQHPQYTELLPLWRKLSHCYEGEHAIKEQGSLYLPPTDSHIEDGYPTLTSKGWKKYCGYKTRATFPPYFTQAIETMVGILHQQEATFTLPDVLEPLIDDATGKAGETLMSSYRAATRANFLHGRMGLLAEITSEEPTAIPKLRAYDALSVINWLEDDAGKLQMVLLKESADVLDSNTLNWKAKTRYRKLWLKNGIYTQESFVDTTSEGAIQPAVRGNTLDFIPFVFINPNDLGVCPEQPPKLGLSDLCLAIYRKSADHEYALHMQAQDTVVVIGAGQQLAYNADGTYKEEETAVRVGAGSSLFLPEGGDAKYIGVSSSGLEAQDRSLEHFNHLAKAYALEMASEAPESGKAKAIVASNKTASLRTIAMTTAMAYQSILRMIGQWVGIEGDALLEITVTPNLEFVLTTMTYDEAVKLFGLVQTGGMTLTDYHTLIKKSGITQLDYDEFTQQLEIDRNTMMTTSSFAPLQLTGGFEQANQDDEDIINA